MTTPKQKSKNIETVKIVETVINPETNRKIKKNGRAYKKLVKRGLLKEAEARLKEESPELELKPVLKDIKFEDIKVEEKVDEKDEEKVEVKVVETEEKDERKYEIELKEEKLPPIAELKRAQAKPLDYSDDNEPPPSNSYKLQKYEEITKKIINDHVEHLLNLDEDLLDDEIHRLVLLELNK
jgi:hypothetical protein